MHTGRRFIITHLEIDLNNLVITIEGADKFWALKSRLTVPRGHITGVTYDPDIAKTWQHGFKLMGTHIPGVITAGTFFTEGKKIFWDVHDPMNTIVISLQNEKYHQLIIEVEDPEREISRLSVRT